MTNEAQIQKFLYHLNTDNYAEADKTLAKVIKDKLNTRFHEAYEKAEEIFSNKTAKQKGSK